MVISPSKWEREARPGKMVKIVEIEGQLDAEIEGQLDADRDDDCYEIDPAEFTKKVHLKASDDDVLIVATKGQVESEWDKCVFQKLSAKNITDVLHDGKCIHVDEDERRFEVIPDRSVVKCEPEDRNGVEEDAYCPEMDGFNHDELYPEQYRVFDEEDDDDVVVVERVAL